MNIIIPVLILSLIGAVLATLLVVAERFIANYGECTVTVNDDKKLTVRGGNHLLAALVENKLFIPSACGGKGTCGYCKVRVLEGAGPVLPTETPFLEPEELANQVRLSCQVKVRNDLSVRIPEELLAVKEYRAVCADITELTYDIKQFRFELREPEAIKFIPGQYVQLLAPAYPGNNEEVYRAYSVSSDATDERNLELIIRQVPGGICTTYCFEHLKVGDEVRLNGPYGEFRLTQTQAPMIFIAGGSGMAPIKSILHQMQNENIERPATYFFGANLIKEMFFTERMQQFEKELPDFTYVPVVARPETDWSGETGLVTEAVPRRFDDLSQHEGYLCGSPGMIDASIKVLRELGMPADKVFYDKFA